MMKRRGINLGTTLILSALLVTLLFSLSAASLQHLQYLTRMANSDTALQLARSAVSGGIERIIADPSFSGTVTVPGAGDAQGLLSFSAGQGVPVSTNNLANGTAVAANDGVTSPAPMVPGNGARLVGVGRCAGVTRQVEAYLCVPPFPYAIAVNGPLDSHLGGLEVGGVASPPSPSSPLPPPAQLLPADILSNAPSSSAVKLGPSTEITGDVEAVGGILPSSAQVLGQIRSGQSPQQLPVLSVPGYDPQGNGLLFNALSSNQYSGGRTYSGVVRRQGDVSFSGGLTLQDAVFYVDGNLAVTGGLSGSGVVAATGNVTLDGTSSLVASAGLAVLAGGDLSLHGVGRSSSFFQGILYAQGDCTADSLTVVGALVCNGTRPTVLSNLAAISAPVSVSITSPGGGGGGTPGSFLSGVNVSQGGSVTQMSVNITSGSQATAANFTTPSGIHIVSPISSFGDLYNLLQLNGVTPVVPASSVPGYTGGSDPTAMVASQLGDFPGFSQDATLGLMTPAQQSFYSLDLNKMLALSQKMRVSLWREY